MATSQNHWTVLDTAPPVVEMIPGVLKLRVAPGPVAVIFTDLAQQFHAHVERVDLKVEETPGYDDWGWAKRPVRGSTTVYSNHASGTAIDLNATRHPRGVSHTFKQPQIDAIRSMLRRYRDSETNRLVVRWGGDFQTTVDDMHFEINAGFEAVRRVATKLTAPKPIPVPPVPVKETDMLNSDKLHATGAARDFLQARGAVLVDNNGVPVAKGKDGYVTYEWLSLWSYISHVQRKEALEQNNRLLTQSNELLAQIVQNTATSAPLA